MPWTDHFHDWILRAQAQSNLGALGWRLSASEVAELDSVSARLGTGTVQNIFQTK